MASAAAAAAARRLSPSTGFYTGLAILPIGRTLVDNPTADMRPAFGSPIPVFAKVDADSNGTFVDFYHAIAVLNEVGNKLEHFQRCYLHHSQVCFCSIVWLLHFLSSHEVLHFLLQDSYTSSCI